MPIYAALSSLEAIGVGDATVSADQHAVMLPIELNGDEEEAARRICYAFVDEFDGQDGFEVARHRLEHDRPRLREALGERPPEGRAALRAPGGADHPAARLRGRRRRDDSAPARDRLDHRRARPDRDRRPAVGALVLRREHAHGDGPRARDRLRALRRLPLPRGAERAAARRPRRSPPPAPRPAARCSSAAARSCSRCAACCSSRTRSCARSPPARSSSASSRSSPRSRSSRPC